jgi:phosphate:Na+ symporter
MAHSGLIGYQIAAAMILGANIGTTVDAALASIGTKTTAKQAALVHVLFNVIGTFWALIFFKPLLNLVDLVTPGFAEGSGITVHLAMLHTVFNIVNTLLFFPFVTPFARLVSFLIKDRTGEGVPVLGPYRLVYKSGSIQDAPELAIVRATKEIRDMAGIASSMYAKVSAALSAPPNPAEKESEKEKVIESLLAELKEKEYYADDMREELTRFLMECTRRQLNPQSESNVSQLFRIVADLEEMTDDCYSIGLLLERGIKKGMVLKHKELEALTPYVGLVEEFLGFVREHLGSSLSKEHAEYAHNLEKTIDKSQGKLRKLGRKRIEAGEDVKTELLFIDLVRCIEKLGDYCYDIAESLMLMQYSVKR